MKGSLMNGDFRSVVVTQTEVQTCLEFAKNFTSNTSQKSDLDFGHSNKPRDSTDSLADVATGKIGELAFQKVCVKLNYKVGVDFQITAGRHNIDYGQDIPEIEVGGRSLTPLISIDIKTVKGFSHWLLLESHKHWASVLVLITTDLPSDAEKNLTAFNKDVKCEFVGFAYLLEFYDSRGIPWFTYKEGMKLLSPSFVDKLYKKAIDNHGIVTLRQQLTMAYKELGQTTKINIGPPLKCPLQVGLPRNFLRKSESELIELLKFISELSVTKAQASNDVIQSILKLNYRISTAGKEFKQK